MPLISYNLELTELLLLDVSYERSAKLERVVDLDVDIGADAVDYKYG
jgi:hypothetical protein